MADNERNHQHSDDQQSSGEGESQQSAGDYLKELSELEKDQLNQYVRETFPSRST